MISVASDTNHIVVCWPAHYYVNSVASDTNHIEGNTWMHIGVCSAAHYYVNPPSASRRDPFLVDLLGARVRGGWAPGFT